MNYENETGDQENVSKLIDFLDEYPQSEEFTKDFDAYFEEITRIEECRNNNSIKLNWKKQPIYQLGTLNSFFVNSITDIQEMETPEVRAILGRIKEENILLDINEKAKNIDPELRKPKNIKPGEFTFIEEVEEFVGEDCIQKSYLNKGGITDYLIDLIDKGNTELRAFYEIEPKQIKRDSPLISPYSSPAPTNKSYENGFPAVKLKEINESEEESFDNKELSINIDDIKILQPKSILNNELNRIYIYIYI